jgi:uncharacterized protein (DUF1810 family)
VSDPYNLQRFVEAQDGVFGTALAELSAGRKHSHWMWFIFPQLAGLARSATAQFFALRSAGEARAYLDHPLLGERLRQATDSLLPWTGKRSADDIFGAVDAMKLRSSLTLFDVIAPADRFDQALSSFFAAPDERTLALLAQAR